MRKNIMAVVLSCLTIFALVASSFAVTFSASAVSVDEMTKAAVQIISRSEGTYGTINPNDNGAVSIGMLQWHADRALQLMRSIANADTGSAQSSLGSSFYNEVMNASNWDSRTFSSAESTAASNLLTTSAGKSKQDALAYSDVQGYISAGQNLGISNAGVLVYYAELYNRGMGVAKRILNAAAGGGSYSSVTLSKLHTTALANSSSYYTDRLNNAYNTIVSLGRCLGFRRRGQRQRRLRGHFRFLGKLCRYIYGDGFVPERPQHTVYLWCKGGRAPQRGTGNCHFCQRQLGSGVL